MCVENPFWHIIFHTMSDYWNAVRFSVCSYFWQRVLVAFLFGLLETLWPVSKIFSMKKMNGMKDVKKICLFVQMESGHKKRIDKNVRWSVCDQTKRPMQSIIIRIFWKRYDHHTRYGRFMQYIAMAVVVAAVVYFTSSDGVVYRVTYSLFFFRISLTLTHS